VLGRGEAFRLPAVAHTVRVNRAGQLTLQPDDGAPEPLTEPRRLGALTVSAAPVSEHPFGVAPWHRDLAVAIVLLTYFGALVAVAAAQAPLGITPDSVDREALSRAALLKSQAHAPRLRFELSPDWHAAPVPEALPERRGEQHMILPEAPAPERGPRVASQRAHAADARPGGTGARAQLEAGPVGNPRAPAALGTWAVAHRYDDTRVRLSKEPKSSGMEFDGYALGFQRSSNTRYWGLDRTPDDGFEIVVASFGEVSPKGFDDRDTVGNMFGPEPTDPRGKGLATAGIGPGGSGAARGIGIGRVGSLGHGAGSAWDQGSGVPDASPFTRSASLGEHVPRAPSFAPRLSSSAAERVLAREAPRLRACSAEPSRIDFTITPDGRAANIAVTGAAAACLRRVVSSLHFATASAGVQVAYHLR
jgi:hypothetical protein